MSMPAMINKKMTFEGKINYLEKLCNDGICISNLPTNYISEDNILVNNVITNLKSAYQKDKLSIKQITRCEELGIRINGGKFEVSKKNDTNCEIEYLKKALKEGIVFSEYVFGEKSKANCSISLYIDDLRKKYASSELTVEQIETCINELKIIIPKNKMTNILNSKIRESALKNIVFGEQINELF